MTNQRSSGRRSFPPYDESSKLSQRDQTLARVENLLSEQFIVPLQDEVPPEEDGPADLVDLEEAVETAKLPPEERPRPRVLAPAAISAPVAPTENQAGISALPSSVEPLGKKNRLSVFSATLQGAILIFVLAWVFLLGVLVGRGHIWQSGLGRDLVVWVEQKAGWSEKAGPEVVLKKDNLPDEVITPSATDQDRPGDSVPEAGPDDEAAAEPQPADGVEPAAEQDEMPVWNWPGWTPGPADNPLGEPEGADERAAPDETSEAAPAGDHQAAENPAPAAEAGGPEEETWPTAIEDDNPGPAVEYQPPGDHDEDEDYDSMMEASEVPDATLAEAAPLPPAQEAEVQGTGKFAVQVAMAASADEAQRKVALLLSQGFNAYYYDNNNGRFPVRVGHFATRQGADEVKVRLEELGHSEPYVSVLGN